MIVSKFTRASWQALANRLVVVAALVSFSFNLAHAQEDFERLPPPEGVPYPSTGYNAPPLMLSPPAPTSTPKYQPPVDAPVEVFTEEAAPAEVESVVESLPPSKAIAAPVVAPVESSIVTGTDESIDSVLTAEPEPVVHWYSPTYWFGPAPWDTAFELGINGSSGTSETLSIRTGGNLKRKTDFNKLALSLYYNKTSADGNETQSNALFDSRYDWLMGDKSPWSIFAMTQIFYDEFQAFDLNVNVSTGIGYQWLDLDWIKLGNTIGAGASREYGGVDDEWEPEANFGFNFEQNVSETQKFYAKVDFFPQFSNFGVYRALTDIGTEIELNRPSNVSLKISVTDRYDSEPGGVPPHNTNYSVLLLWKL